MPRGGRRQGVKGKRYTNRSDLRQPGQSVPVQAATGQPYGAAGQQMEAQRAIPLTTPGVAPQRQQGAPYPAPGSLGALDRPTERPDEPLTAGAAAGPGPGPEVLPLPADDVADRILAAFAAFPTSELLELTEEL